jgi:hypothetical protein
MEEPAASEAPPGRGERQARRGNGAERAQQQLMPMTDMMKPTLEAGLGLLEDAREFTLAAAEQIEDHIRVLEEGWNDLRNASTPEDFSRIAGRVSYTMTRQWADGAGRAAKFMQNAVSRRMRVGSAFTAAMPRAEQRAR